MKRAILIVLVSIAVIASLLYVASNQQNSSNILNSAEETDDNAILTNSQNNETTEELGEKLEEKKEISIHDLEFDKFTDNQLRDLYNNLNFPGTVSIVERPYITGNDTVDDFIANRAEKRGYILREIPKNELVQFEGLTYQAKLLDAWKSLRQDATKAGLSIKVVSAYRSIEEQRSLFVERMKTFGVDYTSVSTIDESALDKALSQVAPPGYSRHHNGYTIDLASPGYSVFEYSPAYEWLVKDNYDNAKKYGFIPSYPKHATYQGPNPEAWEYVWSDNNILIKQ